ncbi:MAG: SemiSWEET transporter [Bacteroidota bacterium]|nr:SemiSWEET transporter [Bacteroidota bacterium]
MLSTYIGFMAAIGTTISFLPQVIKTWKSRSAKDLSLEMFLIFFIGTALWLIYGIMVGDKPVMIANLITLLLSGIILFFKLKYRDK